MRTRPVPRSLAVSLAVLFGLAPAGASAQVNIEKVRGGPGRPGLSAEASADLSVRSGNVDVTEATGEIRLDLVREAGHGFLLGRGGVGWKDDERFSNSGLLHARAGIPVRSALELETFAQIDYDKSRRLDFRALAGAGPRVRVSAGKSHTVTVGTAYLREHEEYDLSPAARHPRDGDVSRWSNYLNVAAGTERVAAGWILYAQPRFDRFDDVRILTEVTFSTAIGAKVDVRNVLRLRWDSEPPDGIEETDLTMVTGFTVRL